MNTALAQAATADGRVLPLSWFPSVVRFNSAQGHHLKEETMEEEIIYRGAIPVKRYVQKVADLLELESVETVMLLQKFTDWLALERAPGEEVTRSVMTLCMERAARNLGGTQRLHLNNMAAEVGLQPAGILLELDVVGVDAHG